MHKSSAPDSYTLLFIVKSYLNVSVVMSDMHACTKSFLKKTQIDCVFATLWADSEILKENHNL